MNRYQRYAIYYLPRPESALAALGRKWLGIDPETGERAPPPSLWIESPRRYGFHATLKAPMRLADGIAETDLLKEVSELANKLDPVNLGALRLSRLGSFLALINDQVKFPEVTDLAWRCVTTLDPLRAPLSEAEISRRKNITPAQHALLVKWGYPFVGPEFRFHMTLSSSLTTTQLDEAEAVLAPSLIDVLEQDIILDQLSVLGDPGNSMPFELVRRFNLKGL
ncbi:MAG: DUF1045 domain-containing protein [Pseudomonadota bacterium]